MAILGIRLCLAAGLAFSLLIGTAGCGLVGGERVDFRPYPLQDIELAEAAVLVRDVTQRFMTERFGGVTLEWDDDARNLRSSPVYDGDRRLTIFIHLEPRGGGVDVEMMALVERLRASRQPAQVYGDPKQDIYLEEMLYEAMVAEYVRRRPQGS
jgi:hypothetical protein